MLSPSNKILLNRPTADASTVEELVARARRGLIRIPEFQRGLRWKAQHVVQLFDSIYKGYPIGSFLLQKKSAPADKVQIGPLLINAPEVYDAWWVVDGQHRLASLAAGLAHPNPVPTFRSADDPYAVYFDAKTLHFEEPPIDGVIPSTWVPIAQLLNASGLIEWIFKWKHSKNDELRTAVFEVGTRIRQYSVPLYIIETEDETTLRDIFTRTNKTGTLLKPDEIYKGLFGNAEKKLSTLTGLAEELSNLGMGQPSDQLLIPSLLAYKNLNPTRTITEHYQKDALVLADAVQESLPTLRRVFSFLEHESEIPHLRLLPRAFPLTILTRFFSLFPEPNDRAMQLLTRWIWRTLQGGAIYDERTLMRRGVAFLGEGDAEDNAIILLKFVRSDLPEEVRYRLPERFDARTAETRLAMLGLTSLVPKNLLDRSDVDIAELINLREADAFRPIISAGRHDTKLVYNPANRILLPGYGSARRELTELNFLDNEEFFRSHAINFDAWQFLRRNQIKDFLEQRQLLLEKAARGMGDRLAAWGQIDRPSISHILGISLPND